MSLQMICILCLSAFNVAAPAEDATRSDDERALVLIAEQEKRIPALEAELDAARAEGIPVAYPQADLTIATLFCRYCRDDVAHDRFARAIEVAEEVRELLDRVARELRKGVAVPVLKVGTTAIRDGSFWGTCKTGEKEEVRPVFLTGYGHFSAVVEAIPTLAKIGINVIQIEQGPRGVVLEDGTVDTAPIESSVLPALDRARDHGVSICLLTSPHYFPGWALEKWPELRVESGFLKNSVEAPQAREIYERYLRTLIPVIKDHPALHSICLSNEPVYTGAADDPFRQPLWHAYLERKHGDIATLNRAYGTAYTSFADVPHPKLSLREHRAALYDAVRLNQERFAEWHAWMVRIIHELAPDLPCHAKVMPIVWGRGTVFWGTDPWDFAELSQINGNDCYFVPNYPKPPWESEWMIQNMYYDLQRSMKRVPVFNTENHIIPDRTKGYVSPDHIYAAIWQGAVHGQGGSTTWAWQRTYDAKSDFEGLILHRAACTAAMSRCALDLMRLSREVAALQNVPPRVVLLYSHAATIHDARATRDRDHVYEALNFCGMPIGFITDEQVAAGWLEKYDCLIVAGAKAVARAAIDAVRAHIGNGGRVFAYGKGNMTEDEYGRDVEPPAFTKILASRSKSETLRNTLARAFAAQGIEADFALRTLTGKRPFGVEWRSATLDGHALLNLVNLTRDPITVVIHSASPRASGVPWEELIDGASLESAVRLAPNTPKLLRQ